MKPSLPAARLVFCALLAAFPSATAAPPATGKDSASFEPELKAIMAKVIAKDIDDIAALKGKYPELEHFGDAPWFTRTGLDFRYDYKTKATGAKEEEDFGSALFTALPGGCGLYFRYHPTYGPPSKFSNYYAGQVSGSDYNGVSYEFCITVDAARDGLKQELCRIIAANMDLSAKLVAEYELKKLGGKADTASVIRALGNPDRRVYESAMQSLAGRKLAAADLAALKEGYLKGAFSMATAPQALDIVKQYDDAGLPEFARALAEASIKSESAVNDISPRNHSGFSEQLYNARWARQAVIAGFAGGREERFMPAAQLILDSDPVGDNQAAALDYFAKLPAEKGGPAILGAFLNRNRAVQARAAELAASQRIAGAEGPLKALLASPGSKVRLAAVKALQTLGAAIPDPLPARGLPESATRIADSLLKCDPTDDEILAVSSETEKKAGDPLPVKPDPAQLPEQVTMADDKTTSYKTYEGVEITTTHYHLELHDLWRMSAVDAASVKKRGAQYALGFGNTREWKDDPGPLLLAAAIKFKDTATARAVYERLCDKYIDDDAILSDGVETLAWARYREGLARFQLRNDNAAVESFTRVTSLAQYHKPDGSGKAIDLTGAYIAQSLELITDIARRHASGEKPAPVFPEPKGCIAYWSQQYPDKAKRIQALIAHLDDAGAKIAPAGGLALIDDDPLVLALVNEGDDAVAPLIACLERDTRLTRMLEFDWDHAQMPVCWAGTVRDAAYGALQQILKKDFMDGQEDDRGFDRGDVETIEKIAARIRDYEKTRKADPAPAAKPGQ